MIQLDKHYDPKLVEDRWTTFWEERGFHRADPEDAGDPYTIVIPPPNITGSLHIGHAFNNTLQDILIRWRRMQPHWLGRIASNCPGSLPVVRRWSAFRP